MVHPNELVVAVVAHAAVRAFPSPVLLPPEQPVGVLVEREGLLDLELFPQASQFARLLVAFLLEIENLLVLVYARDAPNGLEKRLDLPEHAHTGDHRTTALERFGTLGLTGRAGQEKGTGDGSLCRDSACHRRFRSEASDWNAESSHAEPHNPSGRCGHSRRTLLGQEQRHLGVADRVQRGVAQQMLEDAGPGRGTHHDQVGLPLPGVLQQPIAR